MRLLRPVCLAHGVGSAIGWFQSLLDPIPSQCLMVQGHTDWWMHRFFYLAQPVRRGLWHINWLESSRTCYCRFWAWSWSSHRSKLVWSLLDISKIFGVGVYAMSNSFPPDEANRCSFIKSTLWSQILKSTPSCLVCASQHLFILLKWVFLRKQ